MEPVLTPTTPTKKSVKPNLTPKQKLGEALLALSENKFLPSRMPYVRNIEKLINRTQKL